MGGDGEVSASGNSTHVCVLRESSSFFSFNPDIGRQTEWTNLGKNISH